MATKKKKNSTPKGVLPGQDPVTAQFIDGNQLWKLAKTPGRKRKYETAEDLWQAACEYFKWCDTNPLVEVDFMATKNGIQEVHIPKKQVYTIWGLQLHIGVNHTYLQDIKRKNEGDGNSDLSVCVSMIEETIKNQKFVGAASGFFNANFIARDLKMNDTVENINNNLNTDMSKDQIIALNQKLKDI